MSEAQPADPDGFSAFVRLARRHKSVVVVPYCALLGGFLFVSLAFSDQGALGWVWLTHLVGQIFGDPVTPSVLNIGLPELGLPEPDVLLSVVGFVALQGVAVWGLGSVRVHDGPRSVARFWFAVAAIGVAAGVVLLGLLFALLEFVDLGHRGTLLLGEIVFGDNLPLVVVGAGWATWMVVAVLYVRRRQAGDAIGRLLAALLAASWIEFAVALSVEVALRHRHADCPCALSSFFALTIGGPVLLFLIGPALVVLFSDELSRCRRNPSRIRRLLTRRSRKATTA